jgi:hypothetical protein
MYTNKRLKDTKSIVRDIFMEHQDWNARQIYDRYLALIGDTNKAVTLNAIQKHIEELKEILQKEIDMGSEEVWHLGISEGISAEAISRIIRIKKLKPDKVLKVRQVRWINKLHATIPKDDKDLYDASVIYAMSELACKMSKTTFDSSEYDLALSKSVNYLRNAGLERLQQDYSLDAFRNIVRGR